MVSGQCLSTTKTKRNVLLSAGQDRRHIGQASAIMTSHSGSQFSLMRGRGQHPCRVICKPGAGRSSRRMIATSSCRRPQQRQRGINAQGYPSDHGDRPRISNRSIARPIRTFRGGFSSPGNARIAYGNPLEFFAFLDGEPPNRPLLGDVATRRSAGGRANVSGVVRPLELRAAFAPAKVESNCNLTAAVCMAFGRSHGP